jgi:hypothetical protein
VRKLYSASLMALVLMLATATQGQGHSLWKHPKIRACMEWDWRGGDYQTGRMIKCYARVFDAPGTPSFALCIARRESGLDPRATSPGGSYRGLFQQANRYWSYRYDLWGRPHHLFNDIYNGRTNAVVSMKMAKSAGTWYDDWGAASYCD